MDVHGQQTGFALGISERRAGTLPPPTPSLHMKKMRVHEKKHSWFPTLPQAGAHWCGQSQLGPLLSPAYIATTLGFKLEQSLLRWSPAPRLQDACVGLSHHSTRRRDAGETWSTSPPSVAWLGLCDPDRGGEHEQDLASYAEKL